MWWWTAIIFGIVTHSVSGESCADQCQCSEGIVDCSNRNLTHIPTITGKSEVVLLNLSNNSIQEINENDFEDFSGLITLDLSHNKIDTIQIGSFRWLKNLKTFKISHSFLIYTPRDIFSSNSVLEEIYLNDNNLESTPDFPDTLKHLDLRASKISDFSPLNLHQLIYLDISHNKLGSIPHETLNSLSNIRKIFVHSNPWKCLQTFESFVCWCYYRSEVSPHTIQCKNTRQTGRKGFTKYDIHMQHIICEEYESLRPREPQADVTDIRIVDYNQEMNGNVLPGSTTREPSAEGSQGIENSYERTYINTNKNSYESKNSKISETNENIDIKNKAENKRNNNHNNYDSKVNIKNKGNNNNPGNKCNHNNKYKNENINRNRNNNDNSNTNPDKNNNNSKNDENMTHSQLNLVTCLWIVCCFITLLLGMGCGYLLKKLRNNKNADPAEDQLLRLR